MNNMSYVFSYYFCFIQKYSAKYIILASISCSFPIPPIKLDPDIGSFDWQVKQLEKFYNNLDRSQDNVEKL
jgi:hypothetical protein